MTQIWTLASLWLGLALLATLSPYGSALPGSPFGSISALFGLNHGIIDQAQYSHLITTVIQSTVIPTLVANARYLPRHSLKRGGSHGVNAKAEASGEVLAQEQAQ